MSDEVEVEEVPGLPGALPAGERLLWQGRPDWRGLARSAFKVRWLAAYFALFLALRVVVYVRDGATALQALAAAPLALGGLALVYGLAWVYARSTIYTLTTRRLVLRIGAALPISVNLPFKQIAAADVRVFGAQGDVVLRLLGPDHIAWLNLWPHVLVGHFSQPRPVLRALPDVDRVAGLLGEAVKEWAAKEGAQVRVQKATAPALSVVAVGAPHGPEAHAG